MRVIGGKYKGKRFSPPKNFPSRTTTDFAKEALFNIIGNQFDLDELAILDLFAGTGSISLEFVSRGAKLVTSIDSHFVSYKFMRASQESLDEKNWKIIKKDAFRFVQETSFKYDLIFADPPFDLKDKHLIVETIFSRNLLTKGGVLIVEHGREDSFENIPQFKEMRNYGGVQFSFFEE